jgi:hypothetical protein
MCPVDDPRPRDLPSVRLSLVSPNTLDDLRTFMQQTVTLGMPGTARMECESLPQQAIILTSPLSQLGGPV